MSTLADTLAKAVADAVVKVLADSKGELEDIAKAGGAGTGGSLLGDVGALSGVISGVLGAIPGLEAVISELEGPLGAVEGQAGKAGEAFGLGTVVGFIGSQLLEPILLSPLHYLNAATTNQIFDPTTAATLAAKGIISSDFAKSESSGGGLDEPHQVWLQEAARNYPQLDVALRLLNLDLASEDEVKLWLTRQQVPADHQDRLIQLRRLLLSPADLALANLRGFMDDSTLAGYAKQLGITPADMDVLVKNTGEPPGLMQLLEAFRRGFIDRDRLRHGIRQSRVRDEWTDVVERLRYSPMPVADAITAAIRGYITEDHARQIADENGLLPDQFDALYHAHGRPIADGQALQLFNRGLMSAEQVKQVVRESDVKDKYVDNVLQLSVRLLPYFEVKAILQAGVRSKEWGIKQLMMQGYTQDEADAVASASTASKVATLKSLTESQVLELYEAKDITRAQADELLHNIGYEKDETAYILDAAQARATLAEQSKAVNAIRRTFLVDRITAQDASNELDAIGVMADRRDMLIRDWKVEREGIVKVPTEGQFASAVYYGILTYDYAERRLKAMGYSDDDARLLLDVRLHGIQPGTQPPTGAPAK